MTLVEYITNPPKLRPRENAPYEIMLEATWAVFRSRPEPPDAQELRSTLRAMGIQVQPRTAICLIRKMNATRSATRAEKNQEKRDHRGARAAESRKRYQEAAELALRQLFGNEK